MTPLIKLDEKNAIETHESMISYVNDTNSSRVYQKVAVNRFYLAAIKVRIAHCLQLQFSIVKRAAKLRRNDD